MSLEFTILALIPFLVGTAAVLNPINPIFRHRDFEFFLYVQLTLFGLTNLLFLPKAKSSKYAASIAIASTLPLLAVTALLTGIGFPNSAFFFRTPIYFSVFWGLVFLSFGLGLRQFIGAFQVLSKVGNLGTFLLSILALVFILSPLSMAFVYESMADRAADSVISHPESRLSSGYEFLLNHRELFPEDTFWRKWHDEKDYKRKILMAERFRELSGKSVTRVTPIMSS